MTGRADELSLPLSRPLPPSRRPARSALRLHDGYRTSMYVYAPPAEPARPPVVYLHGIQSHPGWFSHSAAALADRGHPVFQPTRRGSGDNLRDRGHARSARQLLRDVADACRFALRQTGRRRLHLVGVSWGGKLAAALAVDPPADVQIASVALVAPGLVPRVDVPAATKLAIGLSLLVCGRKRWAIPLNDVALFTDNEEMRQYLRADQGRLHRATARLLYASRQLDRLLARAPNGSLRAPTTLLLARRDRIIDNARTRQAVERLTGGHAVVREFDAAHTLEFEPDPGLFYESLCEAVSRDA
jgi:acylglycerol lipase